jgi:mono/diheme cytochrome c family protein
MSRWTQVVVAAAFVCGICAWSAVVPAVQAQATTAQATAAPSGSGLWAGVYTEEQAKRGEALATKVCSACHGVGLVGAEAGPALAGLEFIGNWSSLSVGQLFDRIYATMPADAPKSLSQKEYIDVISYILQLNKFPAGSKELATDATTLGTLMIESQPPAK